MPFCPFFSTNCPESNEGDAGCEIWTDFGCCMIDKPGIPATYSGVSPSIEVFILQMFSEKANPTDAVMIVYAITSTGAIEISDTLSDFAVHRLY